MAGRMFQNNVYFCLNIFMKRLLLLFIIGFLVQSCARVGSPVGGPKDSLAPKFLSSNIDSTRINVKRDIRELRLDFDEYITLKDINKNLIISPPIKNIKRILPSNIANKFILIQWTDTLKANTTYNFNFGNSIVDNNEANILRYFNFAFSTGDKLDDLYISGEVKDALAIKKQASGDRAGAGRLAGPRRASLCRSRRSPLDDPQHPPCHQEKPRRRRRPGCSVAAPA